MYDEWEPAPLDGHDLTMMGLRAPRCNGCEYNYRKWKLGDRFYSRMDGGWVDVYEKGREPGPKQEITEIDGEPVYHLASFMSIGHSDECWGFTEIPDTPYVPPAEYDPKRQWRTKAGRIIEISDLGDTHLLNILKLVKVDKIRVGMEQKKALRKQARGRQVKITNGLTWSIDRIVYPEEYRGVQGLIKRILGS